MKILSDQPAPLAMLDPTGRRRRRPGRLQGAGQEPGRSLPGSRRDEGRPGAHRPAPRDRGERRPHDDGLAAAAARHAGGADQSAGTGRHHRQRRQCSPCTSRPSRPPSPPATTREARQELQLATQAAPGHLRLGEMGAKISQARTERELARSIGEAQGAARRRRADRGRPVAGAGAEGRAAGARGRGAAPARSSAPPTAASRIAIAQRRVAASLAHAREAIKGGHADTAMRAVTEALGLSSGRCRRDGAEGRDRGGACRRRRRACRRPPPVPLGPPPPALARSADRAAGAAADRRAPGRRSAPPPPAPSRRCIRRRSDRGRAGAGPQRARPSRRRSLPLAFLGIAAVAAILFGFAALFVWRYVQSHYLTAPTTTQQPGHAGGAEPSAPTTPGPKPSPTTPAPATPGPNVRTEPSPTPRRAAHRAADDRRPSEDAAITTRLARRRRRLPGAADGDGDRHAGQPDRRGAAARRPAPDRRAVGAGARDARQRGPRERAQTAHAAAAGDADGRSARAARRARARRRRLDRGGARLRARPRGVGRPS